MQYTEMGLNETDLRKVQLIQLEMLLEVDRICRENGIKYCIIAGTLLGAVRHRGYIPWDDDADVALLRSEYVRFRDACKHALDRNRFYFQDYTNTSGYRWGYGKLRRKNTAFIRKGQEHMPYPSGIFIDIFPLDNVPNSRLKRYMHNLECTLLRKMLWSAVGCKSDPNRIFRFLFILLNHVPASSLFAWYENLVKRSNKQLTHGVRILTFPTPNKQYRYKRKWYESLSHITFEAFSFPAPRDYRGYLHFKFGDYKVYPPVSQRKGHALSYYELLPDEIMQDLMKR